MTFQSFWVNAHWTLTSNHGHVYDRKCTHNLHMLNFFVVTVDINICIYVRQSQLDVGRNQSHTEVGCR